MSVSPERRFPWARYLYLLCGIVVVAALPLLSVLFTYAVAGMAGCSVNEARVQPCMIMGMDWGALLYATGVLGWLMLASIPLGAMALLALLVIYLVHYLWWRRMKDPAP